MSTPSQVLPALEGVEPRAVRAAKSADLIVTPDAVIATLTLSRGCPDGVVCALPPGGAVFRSEAPELAPAGLAVQAQWALYPLDVPSALR